ncbi:MAG: UvrD-helicase domain-containing protein [Bacteroidota bacterium]
MSNRNFVIYKSSAGSGKTYTLTREYLKLAFTRENYYKHILAVTFTNKAMQEMKNRIIQKLDEFGQGRFDTMANDLMGHLNLEAKEFQQRSAALLSRILHGYSHFSISTIDSFFQKVIRSFSRELGLAGSYRLELDYDLILIQIVNDLLLEVETNKNLRKWLIAFTMERLGDGKSWDVQKELRSFARELFREELQDLELDQNLKSETGILEFLKQLDYVIKSYDREMQSIGESGKSLLAKYGLTVEDFTQKKRGVAAHLDKIILGNDYKPNNYVYQALNDHKWYPAKSPKAAAIDGALQNGLHEGIEQAVTLYEDGHVKYATAKAIRKFIYGYGLLSDLSRKLQEYKAEHDVMLISDATRFLRELVQDTDAPFVYEKVGSFFNHYLIDEFQDTSAFQWQSFRPLIENSMAEGNQNLLVGDVKQSIYRWRGGDLELLQSQVQEQFGDLQTKVLQLNSNYRSEARVVQFNNAVFKQLPLLFSSKLGDRLKGDSGLGETFDIVYSAVEQKIPEVKLTKQQGYIDIQFYEDEEDYNWREKVNEVLPSRLEKLQDKGIPLREIAILVRENKEGKEVADLLMNYQKEADSHYCFDVVSNESLFLSSSAAVNTLIAALYYLHEPKDTINKAQLAYNYRVLFGKQDRSLHVLFSGAKSTEEFDKLMPDQFPANREKYLRMPLFELLEELIATFELNKVNGQFAYLQTFQDQVLKFISQEQADIHSFLIWWEETGKKQSIKVADDLDAIKILTIHKAKGLEFHTVLIPYCNWTLDHKMSPVLWNAIQEAPFDMGPLPLRYSSKLSETYFKADYQLEMSKAYLDSLNMLYVAMTRAVDNLVVFAPQRQLRKQGLSELLYSLLSNEQFDLSDGWNSGAQRFIFGELGEFEGEQKSQFESAQLDSYIHFNWRQKITVKHSVDVLEEADDRKSRINYGNLVHRILSHVQYMKDFKRALDMVYFEESLNHEEAEELRSFLKQLFKNPLVKHWFDASWQVRNEATILTKESEYRPDRVIWKKGETAVIDYKTGKKDDKYKKQILQYKNLLEQMGHENVKAYLWYLREGAVENI